MPIDNWIAFVIASAILLAIPGPTVLLVVSYALGHGRRSAAAIVAGVALGDFTAMTASMAGLGALLAASPTLFTALRWVGGAYIIYMGIGLWRANVALLDNDEVPDGRFPRLFGHAYAVTALNPSTIMFFVAFVPQFISTTRAFLPQVVLLILTFVTLAALNATAFAMLASAIRRNLRSPDVRRWVNRTGGALLMAMGAAAIAWRKAKA